MSSAPFTHALRVSQLNPRRPNPVDLSPDDEARARIAAALDLTAPPEVRLTGTITAAPNDAWLLEGRLTARVQQACVVTLAPVRTAIDEPVRRVYSPWASTPEGDEVEMPDDEIEPLGPTIDAGAVLVEALALALPPYPRCDDAELPGAALDPDADGDEGARRPFQGLADLLQRKDN